MDSGGCDEVCKNTIGSFDCACNVSRYYEVGPDRVSCVGKITSVNST